MAAKRLGPPSTLDSDGRRIDVNKEFINMLTICVAQQPGASHSKREQ
jgi:hypothetical protein